MKWSVAVFAHNEEKTILGSLYAIIRAAKGQAVIHVLINGCTDRTLAIVEKFSNDHTAIVPVHLEIGDKSNTWNHYIHDISPDADMHFFVDGDVRISPDSFTLMAQGAQSNPTAVAASGVPASGRNKKEWTHRIMTQNGLPGNLYALKGVFVKELRAVNLKLPVGLIGDDSLLQWLIKRNLDPTTNPDKNRIVPCCGAKFRAESLHPYNVRHIRLYLRRLIRYSVRQYQLNILLPKLRLIGLPALPANISSMYNVESLNSLEVRRYPTKFVFDILAKKQMSKCIGK